MLYVILIILIAVLAIVVLALWVELRQKRNQVEGLDEENVELYRDLQEAREERDRAVDNLTVVLKADPTPFDHVATELGLHGVVYQFRSEEFYETMKEIAT
jgi:FtsZ-interacting cell division protein ZipA